MQIIATKVHEPTAAESAFTIEFQGDGGERVSVVMAQTASGSLTRDNALQKAQVILLQAASFGTSTNTESETDATATPSDAVESLNQEKSEKDSSDTELQEGLEDTFPASDPVSSTYTSTAGRDQKV